jgi:Fe-S-cluster-containing hydrogenase component 2
MACAKQCPVNAIDGERKKPHAIRQDACIMCGSCYDACRFSAISRVRTGSLEVRA